MSKSMDDAVRAMEEASIKSWDENSALNSLESDEDGLYSDTEETVGQNMSPPALAGNPENDKEVNIAKHIQAALDGIETAGNFLTCESQDSAFNPGLNVSNVGSIRLPIFADDAKAIIQSCRMSPYGKGTETLLNESVRKSWQLDADQISLQNPKWEEEVRCYVRKAATGLGLQAKPAEVKAELYKLLVYEEGAFFLPHQDSEKADGMFGTLIISLPSKHQGGTVIGCHKGKKITFDTDKNSEFGYSWAAWYADVSHEVKPVTSGYRVVLVYNLIHRPSAALLPFRGNKAEDLTDLLKSWALAAKESGQYPNGWDSSDFRDACPPALVYILEHQYTMSELRFSRLKGADQVRFAELRDACERADFLIFLANIQKMQEGEVLDDGDDDCYGRGGYDGNDSGRYYCIAELTESSLELLRVVDGEGQVVGTDIPLLEKMVVPAGAFFRDPDSEDFTGFTGNEGATATHFYEQTGVLILPKKFQFMFLLQQAKGGDGEIAKLLEETHRVVKENSDDEAAKERLLQICGVVLKSEVKFGMDSIMQIAFELADMELFRRSMDKLNGYFSAAEIFQVTNIILHHGLNPIRASLDKLFSPQGYGGWYEKGLTFGGKMKLISQLAKEYHSICEQQARRPSTEVIEWQDSVLNKVLSTELQGLESDGPALAKALSVSPAPGFLFKSVRFVESHLANTALVLPFIASVYEYSMSGNLDKGEASAGIDRLFPIVIKSFTLKKITIPRPEEGHFSSFYSAKPRTIPISWISVVNLVQLGDATNTDITEIMDKLAEYVVNIKEDEAECEFHKFIFPMACGICEHVAAIKRPFTMAERNFFVGFLRAYVTGYVKRATPPPADWQQCTAIYCACSECGDLRCFINDMNKTVQEFPLNEERRKHLGQQLDESYFTTSVIESGIRVEKTRARSVSNYIGWITRARAGQAELKRLAQLAPLEELLGEDYTSIEKHENLQIPTDLSPSLLSLVEANTSTVPRKRPYYY